MEIPLIVGAGPVGLAAAVFMLKQNQPVRIIDSLPAPSIYSKALAINPRTLELLEPTGLTEKLLNTGKQINEINIYVNGKLKGAINLSKLHHKYPFMLALSQAATEEILAEEAAKFGVNVERNRRLVHCHESNNIIHAQIEDRKSGAKETTSHSWLLGADGAHSAVRDAIGTEFTGSSLSNQWYLVDVALETSLPETRAYAFFLEQGFLFLIPVVDPKRNGSQPIWRLITNFPNPLQHIPKPKAIAAPIWESSFHIGHRIAKNFSKGNIYLAGDAAHIHSPLGARGMNLGIEDAWAFAELMRMGKIDQYAPIREKIDGNVVARVKFLTNAVNGNSRLNRTLRSILLPIITGLPFMSQTIIKTGTGLDHKAMPSI